MNYVIAGESQAKWLQYYIGVVELMITVYYDSGGSTQRISSQQKRKKKNSNFFFMHVKFVKSLFGGCQNDFNVTKGGYMGGRGGLLGPQKVIT